MIEPIDLGPRLEPPRGGLSRLRQSVSRLQAPRRGIPIRLSTGVAAGIAIVVLLFTGRSMIQNHRIQVAIQGAMSAAQATEFNHAAYQVLPSHGRNVRILLIGTLPTAGLRSEASGSTEAFEPERPRRL